MGKKLKITGEFCSVINFAMQQNHVPVVRRLRITNLTEKPLQNISVHITSDPQMIAPFTTEITQLSPGQTMELSPLPLSLIPSFLLSLTERVEGTIMVTASQGDEQLDLFSKDIALLAYDEWSGLQIMPEITAAFVTPNHPYVADLVKDAASILRRWSKDAVFNGYQSGNPSVVRRQMAAIYAALQCEGIRYALPPASFEDAGQRVRLCDDIRKNKLATCLDLALLYAACLEAVGLYPLLVFQRKHVFVGAWLIPTNFSECIQDDVSQITKRTADGIFELCLSEATGITNQKMSFEESTVAAQRQLNDPALFEYCIDIRRCRTSGIHPIPQRRLDAKGNVIFDYVSTPAPKGAVKKNDLAAPADITPAKRPRKSGKAPEGFTKQQIWERKLLDLSLHNTLLNFRFAANTMQLLFKDLSVLASAMCEDRELALLPRPKEFTGKPNAEKIYEIKREGALIDGLINGEFAQMRIRSVLEEQPFGSAATTLFRTAKTNLEENGANTLYLALGFLRWYESDSSDEVRYAPLVLIPLEITRTSVQNGFSIRPRDEDPIFNITLLELLRTSFGITVEGLDPLPMEGNVIAMRQVFSTMRQAVMKCSRWDLVEHACIAHFSFANYIMWNDLRTRADEMKNHKVVSSLLSGHMTWQDPEGFLTPEQLDDNVLPSDMAVPLSADSSQLSAVYAAGIGKSFVLHGPPGTGKSQTITNMIANALYHGKTVLFIAEKMAALSVVQRRLEAVGLAPFCLELHSDKAKKKDVLGQLDRTLQGARIKTPAQYAEKAERVQSLRRQLNETLRQIHAIQQSGFSLYDNIVRYEEYKEYPDMKVLTDEQIAAMTPEIYRNSEELLRQLKAAADGCGGAFENPLSLYRRTDYTQNIKASFAETLSTLCKQTDALQRALTALTRLIPFRNISTHAQLSSIAELCRELSEINVIPDGLMTNRNIALYRDKILGLCDAGIRRDALYNEITERFGEGILEIDAKFLLNRIKLAGGFFSACMRRRSAYKRLQSYATAPRVFRKKETVSLLEHIAEYQEAARTVRENDSTGEFIFGVLWNHGKCDFSIIRKVYDQAYRIATLTSETCTTAENRNMVLVKLSTMADEGMFAEKAAVLKDMREAFASFSEAEARLAELCQADPATWREGSGYLARMRQMAEDCLCRIDSLRDWCRYLVVKKEAEDAGLTVLTEALESGQIGTDLLLPVYRRSTAWSLAAAFIDSVPMLGSFSGTMMEQRISSFGRASKDFEALTRQELAALLSSRIPSAATDASASSEIAILQRAIRSSGRSLSIRKLFDSIPNLLRCLCPCMLMSPISVAQFISPAFPQFDLVIFDEASQMPTCEAVGSIARAKDVIVVGDPKQLPPTSFFTANQYDEDNYEKEDLESILDDCLAISMPEEHLLWHYRSRHESLIAFSNRQYYDNHLYTFPSPADRQNRVRHIQVDGFYDRGKTKQNRAEAVAVVAEIVRRLKNPKLASQSIGVVTFSSAQQHLIEDLLEAEFAKNRKLEETAQGMYEPIFVKNLENVQGDERDIIMFSVGYGPDKYGRVAMNFGPLNREGGWRRLNVAASRARQEMLVFSVLRPEQIDLDRTSADGIAGLKAFLEFSINGKSTLVSRQGDRQVRPGISHSVAEGLRRMGYEVDTDVGSSAYRIDIAVLNPDRPGEYLLGILCDGDSDRGGTAADRSLLQDSILKSLGWHIHHMWVLDWWDSPLKELDRLRKVIDATRKEAAENPDAPPRREESKVLFETVSPDETADSKTAQNFYKLSHLDQMPQNMCNVDTFCEQLQKTRVVTQLDEIVRCEAPISRHNLVRRMLAIWGLQRSTPRFERTMDDALGFLDLYVTRRGDRVFYWLYNPATTPTAFRVPDPADDKTKRDVADIPTEEIADAVRSVAAQQFSMTQNDLMKEVAKLFGYTRCPAGMQMHLRDGIACAVEAGYVSQDGERITYKGGKGHI